MAPWKSAGRNSFVWMNSSGWTWARTQGSTRSSLRPARAVLRHRVSERRWFLAMTRDSARRASKTGSITLRNKPQICSRRKCGEGDWRPVSAPTLVTKWSGTTNRPRQAATRQGLNTIQEYGQRSGRLCGDEDHLSPAKSGVNDEPHRRTVGPLQPDAAAQDGERVDRQGELNPDPARYLIDHNLAGRIAGFLLTWIKTSCVESSTRWQETPPASARSGTKKLAFKNAVHHGAGRQCTPSLRWQARRWFINMDRYEAKNILKMLKLRTALMGKVRPASITVSR